jgi:hypothetical protein
MQHGLLRTTMKKTPKKLAVNGETLRNLHLISGGVITGGTVEPGCTAGQTEVACGPVKCSQVFVSCDHASVTCSGFDCP